MEPILEVKKKLIKKLFDEGVKLINKQVNLTEFKNIYFPNDDRTLALYIKGMEDLPTGFVFSEGKVRCIDKLNDKPTVRIMLDEDMFLSIACQELTMQQAFFYDYIQIEGENYLRDFNIFQIMFERYPEILEKLNPKRG